MNKPIKKNENVNSLMYIVGLILPVLLLIVLFMAATYAYDLYSEGKAGRDLYSKGNWSFTNVYGSCKYNYDLVVKTPKGVYYVPYNSTELIKGNLGNDCKDLKGNQICVCIKYSFEYKDNKSGN